MTAADAAKRFEATLSHAPPALAPIRRRGALPRNMSNEFCDRLRAIESANSKGE